MPARHLPLQHSLFWVQGTQNPGVQQVPLEEQVPPQHCVPLLHFFPLRLQPGASAAASPMPSDPSVAPTRAAPINLSIRPLESVPLAISVASASKARPLASSLTCSPFPRRGGTRQPRQLANGLSMMCYKTWRNFRESSTAEVPRISLLGTWVNKGKKKGRGCVITPALLAQLVAAT
jgi:hypothetical protein